MLSMQIAEPNCPKVKNSLCQKQNKCYINGYRSFDILKSAIVTYTFKYIFHQKKKFH